MIILDILISFIDILSLALLLWIIHFYIEPGKAIIPAWLPEWMISRDSAWFIILFTLLFALKNLLAYLVSKYHYRFISNVASRLSENKLAQYQHDSFSTFIQTDSSVHIRNINYYPIEFCQFLLSGLQQIITQLALILITIAAILIFNAKLFLLLLCILLPPTIVVFYFIKKRLSKSKQLIQSSNEHSYRYMLDALKGYVESNVYNRNEFFRNRYSQARSQFSRQLFDSLALQSLPGRMIEVFAVMGLCILILIAKWWGNTDSNTLITIGAFMVAAYKIIPGLVKLINAGGQMKAFESSMTELEKTSATETLTKENLLNSEIGSIEFDSVDFEYDRQPVLSGFSMQISKGDFVGIRGQSGRGKTTILNLLLGFLQPTSGEIRLNGKQQSCEDLKKYWPSIAYTRQQGFFIHDTILRNITLEENGGDAKKLNEALTISGLDKMLEKIQEGTNKIITENGKNISGGQQQRISIARALYKDASLILLDEPFNELDDEAVGLLLDHFRKLAASGKTVVMITHDKKSLSYCNKIISLDENR